MLHPRHWRALPLLITCVTAITVMVSAAVSAQQEFSSANKSRGKAAVEYRDKNAHIVAAYYYSQLEHDSRWIMIDTALSTSHDTIIRRDAISLRTPEGREIPLASQRRIGEDVKRIEQLLQNAKVTRHDTLSYFTEGRFEDMQLFRLPFDPVVHNEFVVDRDRVAYGPFFFESPTGAWEDGTYALVINHGNGTAELPIRLE